MAWDITAPSGSNNRGDGAAAIRTFKTDFVAAMQTNGDGIFPGTDTANPVYIHKFKSGNTAARPAAGNAGRWYYNNQTGTIQRDNGTGWDDITCPKDLIPTNQRMVFFNASAPTGWTQDVTHNDRLLRVVVGAGGGTGGTDSISSPPTHTHGGVTGGANISLAHTHPLTSSQGLFWPGGTIPFVQSLPSDTGSADLAHTHTIDAATAYAPKYADVILCYRT